VLRWLLLDAPYFLLVVAVALSRLAGYYHDAYLTPQLALLTWSEPRAAQEVTYYQRVCTTADQSTNDPRELIVDHTAQSADEMVDVMLRHGMAVLPNLLSRETATLLRDSILRHNTVEDNFGVLSKPHRFNYGLRMEQDDPIVRTAVREIATHPSLLKLLPPLLGDADPAISKLHAITSSAGAAAQNYHWDVRATASAVGYARTFAPLYSLFIPLQDTPRALGPTEFCPGSHVCSAGIHFCHQTAFPMLLHDDDDDDDHLNATIATTTTTNGTTTTEPVWPATYGVLMNQQMTHRGGAHTADHGPDRVVLILALTPRPRNAEHVSLLETRTLSLGGAYALHWSQWSHTWSDLYRETMYDPVKTLKSLGLYKPPQSKWGREWLQTILLRSANGEYGDRSSLRTFLKQGGLSYLPKIFHHQLPEFYETEEEEDLVWYFFFYGTFRNVIRWIPVVAMVALALYTVSYTWVLMAVAVMERQQDLGRLLASVRAYFLRMILLHGAAVALFLLLRDHIDRKPWSRHIQQRKLYTLPTSFPSQPELPSTLPVPDDVLMLDDFQSDYMASYTRLYDVGHPGNARWKARLATTGANNNRYSDLPAAVQDALLESLVRQVEQEDLGRFLQKNSLNQWARMKRPDAKGYVHKELLRSTKTEYDVLLREIAYRRSETKFGTWRDTALHRRHIPRLLATLEERLGAVPRPVTEAPLSKAAQSSSHSPRRIFRRRPVLVVPEGSAAPMVRPSVGTDNDNDDATPHEPFYGAWLQVGDRVDALYSELETCECCCCWFKQLCDTTTHPHTFVLPFPEYLI
jgi:hypothetical protein